MAAEKKSKGRPFKVIPLKPETAAALAVAAENARQFLGKNEHLFLVIPETYERASRDFDPSLALLVFLRISYEKESSECFSSILADVMGWENLSPFTVWIERSFNDAVMIAFNANDMGFPSQWATLQELFSRSHFTVQDAIAEAYETLYRILHNPPACPADMDTASEQICNAILTPPFLRPPSNAEIRSYMEWFEGWPVTREQVKNEASTRKWKLSDSRPFPGCSYSMWVTARESDTLDAGDPDF
jgi:hypothetical protein